MDERVRQHIDGRADEICDWLRFVLGPGDVRLASELHLEAARGCIDLGWWLKHPKVAAMLQPLDFFEPRPVFAEDLVHGGVRFYALAEPVVDLRGMLPGEEVPLAGSTDEWHGCTASPVGEAVTAIDNEVG